MWLRGLQTIGMSLLIEKDSSDRKDSTRKRNMETVAGVKVLRKRKNIAIVKIREGTDRDLDLMEDKDNVITERDKLKADIVDIREVPAIKNSKNNVKNHKN
jgi:hypothetical protein